MSARLALSHLRHVLDRLEAWQDGERIAALASTDPEKHRNAQANYRDLATFTAEAIALLEEEHCITTPEATR